ncbi:Nitrite reductase associated c-type cytochorome NirN [hydrothermal vent metagenome]|uniref:Nitrite reductase associated c-type cytochorome NirN n=1 Tax=hydrothermal vent metagenome TaxID=652676 RepID=A0A3B1AYA8_9ZZZZ
MKKILTLLLLLSLASISFADSKIKINASQGDIVTWSFEDVKNSRLVYPEVKNLSATPSWDADPTNIFTVIETADHHATILDGDTFTPLHRLQTRAGLYGAPKYSPDGRYIYFGTRDGWISQYDLYNLTWVAEVRAGVNMRNFAISSDGQFLLAGNEMPRTLVVLSAVDLSPLNVLEVKDEQGRTSRVSAVYDAGNRHSFIVALKEFNEVWEMSYEVPPPMGFGKWMHDYRENAGENSGFDRSKDLFPVRRIKLKSRLDNLFLNSTNELMVGSSRAGTVQIIDLDLGRVMHVLELPGMPHPGSGVSWIYQGRTILAIPNLKESLVSILDLEKGTLIKQIKTQGSGLFIQTHKNSPYAWVDTFFSANKESVQIIDKRTLKIAKTLKPAPGKTVAHVEFDKQGQHALLSVWDSEGAVIVYDAKTLTEIKRLPMKSPSGKYNVHNRTGLSK